MLWCCRPSTLALPATDRITDMRSVRSFAKIAHLHSQCGSYQRAEYILAACVTAASSLVGAHDPEFAVLLFQLGSLHQRNGQHARAIALLEQCCDIFNTCAHDSPSHRMTLLSPLERARGLSRGQSFSSRRSMQSSLASPASATTTRDSFHRHATHASALLCLGMSCIAQSDFERARLRLEEACSVQAATAGKHTSVYIAALRNLAAVFQHSKDYRQADVLLRECCSLCPAVLGETSLEFAAALRALAEVQTCLGWQSKAAVAMQTCARIQLAAGPAGIDEYLTTLQQLSSLYVSTRQHDKAISTLIEERRVRTSRGDNESTGSLVDNTRALISLYKATQQYAQALELLEALFACSSDAPATMRAMLLKDMADLHKLAAHPHDVVRLLEQVCGVYVLCLITITLHVCSTSLRFSHYCCALTTNLS